MTRPLIALIVGSLRAESLNRKVARAVAARLADRFDVREIAIADLPLFDQAWEDSPPSSVERFRAAVGETAGVLFVTPEYNRGLPGGLKNAIDVGSRPPGHSVWAGKPAGVITASPGATGGFGANHQLRQTAVFLDMPMLQQPEAYLGKVTEASFGADGTVEPGLAKVLDGFAAAYGNWVAHHLPRSTD